MKEVMVIDYCRSGRSQYGVNERKFLLSGVIVDGPLSAL